MWNKLKRAYPDLLGLIFWGTLGVALIVALLLLAAFASYWVVDYAAVLAFPTLAEILAKLGFKGYVAVLLSYGWFLGFTKYVLTSNEDKDKDDD